MSHSVTSPLVPAHHQAPTNGALPFLPPNDLEDLCHWACSLPSRVFEWIDPTLVMDRPNVGDACTFSAPSSHTSAVLAASFPHPVLAEATHKLVILKAALPLCMNELIAEYCQKLMAADSGRHALPTATWKRKSLTTVILCSCQGSRHPSAARTPSHCAVAMLVLTVVVNITHH
ncbi:hypothetical protein K438DRAFT_1997427 [Mycena galopus ATCC 62051]|nr:hypothetical protein K438DRAFT_1997427 [Mycena galopus ATCC 62051]